MNMKNYIKYFLGGLCMVVASFGSLRAQVIDYRVTYNLSTNQYEVYGRATANLTGVNLGGSQMGLVFPAALPNAQLTVIDVLGGDWEDGTPAYAPVSQPGSDFHAISTDGTSSFSMLANVETLLFTVSTGGTCYAGVRMYINGADPEPGDLGMGGADYDTYLEDPNTFTTYTGLPYANGGTICSPLAAQLLDFSGKKNGSDIQLNWSVANEQDLAQYRLLKSTDAKTWSLLTKVTPGAEAGGMTHSYIDAGAGREAVVYYRLQLQDHHGVTRNSETLRFSSTDKEGSFNLVPNPVRSGKDFVLQKDAHGNGVLTVLSSTGQVVARETFRQDQPIKLQTRGWAPGTYLVRWEGDDKEKYVSRLSVE